MNKGLIFTAIFVFVAQGCLALDKAEVRLDEAEARGDIVEAFDIASRLFAISASASFKSKDARELLHTEYLLTRFFVLKSGVKNNLMVKARMAKLLKGDMPEDIRSRLKCRYGNLLASTGDIVSARKTFNELGVIRKWVVVGPFSNERGAGFNEAYGPEKSRDFSASYDGKARKVSWKEIPADSYDAVISLDDISRPRDEAASYAAVAVRMEKDTQAVLRVGCDDGLKSWVNGVEVISAKVRHSLGFDQHNKSIMLANGWNLIVLKIMEEKIDWSFRARLTLPNGKALFPAEICSNIELLNSLKWAEALDVELEAPFDVLVDVEEENAEIFYEKGWVYRLRNAHDSEENPARDAYKRACELDKTSLRSAFALSHVIVDTVKTGSDLEENSRRELLEKVVEGDENHLVARLALAEYYMRSQNNIEKAKAYIDEALKINPKSISAINMYILALRWRGIEDEADALVKKLRDDNPQNIKCQMGYIKLRLENGWAIECIPVLEKLYKTHRMGDGVYSLLVKAYLKIGRVRSALELIDERGSLSPYATSFLLRKASLLEGVGDVSSAIDAIKEALRICPDDALATQRLGTFLQWIGEKKNALAHFEKSLSLNHNNPALQRYVDFLEEKTIPLEKRYPIDIKEIVKTKEDASCAENIWGVQLLDRSITRVFDDGTTQKVKHIVYKILNDVGVEKLDKFRVGYYASQQKMRILVASVYHADGTKDDAEIPTSRNDYAYSDGNTESVDAQRRRAGRTIDFPPLRIGDIVEVQYRVDDMRQSFFGDYFGTVFYFQDTLPTVKTEHILEVPINRNFYFNTKNTDIEPTVLENKEEQTRVYKWSVGKTLGVVTETGMPPLSEVVPTVEVSTFKDWNEFGKWYWSLVEDQFKSAENIKETVLKITKDCKNTDEKTRAIYNFVVSKITYQAWELGVHGFKSYRASTILTRKFGDCKDKATLLCVMLKEIGVEAVPVLIRASQSGRRGNTDLSLPLMHHFNHCIAVILDEDKRPLHYIDGTAEYVDFDTIPSMNYNASVAVIYPTGATLEKIPEFTTSKESTIETIEGNLMPDGQFEAGVVMEANGSVASLIRRSLAVKGSREKRLTRTYGKNYTGAEVLGVDTSNLEDLNESVRIEYDVVVPNYMQVDGETMQMSVPLSGLKGFVHPANFMRLALLEKRKQELWFPGIMKYTQRTLINLPEGFNVLVIPKNVKEETAQSTFSLSVSQNEENRTLEISWTFTIKKKMVPASEYSLYREFCVNVDRALEQDIILSTRVKGAK